MTTVFVNNLNNLFLIIVRRVRNPLLCVFFSAFIIGAIIANIFVTWEKQNILYKDYSSPSQYDHQKLYKSFLTGRKLYQHQDSSTTKAKPEQDDNLINEAEYLVASQPVLCLVLMRKPKDIVFKPENRYDAPPIYSPHESIMKTWGRRCLKIIFFSDSFEDSRLDYAKFIDKWSIYSWGAMRMMFDKIKHEIKYFNWFMIVEDDTYVILPNLAFFVSIFNHSGMHYFGNSHKSWVSFHAHRGSGILLSQGTMTLLYKAFDKKECPITGQDGDMELAVCLDDHGIKLSESRDPTGRQRFISHDPNTMLNKQDSIMTKLFGRYSGEVRGPNCCSDSSITFHDVSENNMFVFEFLTYHLKPFGVKSLVNQPSTIKLVKLHKSETGRLSSGSES